MYIKEIQIHTHIYKITDLWNTLPQQILSLFKERMDIYGRSSVIPTRVFSTLEGTHSTPSIPRQEEILFVNHTLGIISTFSLGLRSQTRWTTTN